MPLCSQTELRETNGMELNGKKLVLVGGAGLIGSHTVDHLLKEDVNEILIYDNMDRGSLENLQEALKDPRVRSTTWVVTSCRLTSCSLPSKARMVSSTNKLR